MDHSRILIPEDELTPLTARPKKIPTVKFRIKPEPSTASASSSANIIVLPPATPDEDLPPPPPAPAPRKKASTARGQKRKEPDRDGPDGDPPAPMITTFDLTSPDLQVNSQIPGTGSSWEHSLSISHGAVDVARGKKKERATRKDKGVPRKKKGVTMFVLSHWYARYNADELGRLPPMTPAPLTTVVPLAAVPAEEYADDVSEGSFSLSSFTSRSIRSTCVLAYSGMADSSPPMPLADLDIEPDPLDLSLAHGDDLVESIAGQPLPAYPAPSRPFSVLPPPKMGSGFAPTLVLDRTRAPVRRWRPVVREVRGIAGGRWFARSWLGDKDSAFGALAAAPAEPLTYAPAKPRRGRGRGGAFGSSGTSRAGSLGPEGSVSAPVRAPTKMRTTVLAPELEGTPNEDFTPRWTSHKDL
jgi:hypothetical protein